MLRAIIFFASLVSLCAAPLAQHAREYRADLSARILASATNPANDTAKIWWVQAEAIAAFAEGLRVSDKKYCQPLDQTIHFVNAFQTDIRDGIWLDRSPLKASRRATARRTHGKPATTTCAHW